MTPNSALLISRIFSRTFSTTILIKIPKNYPVIPSKISKKLICSLKPIEYIQYQSICSHGIIQSEKKKMDDEEFVESIVCQEDDLKENEMKTFDLDENKILLVKQKGKISALGTKCTHYGAPLVSGALGDGRIRCQWHGACFDLATGDIEDFPGLDSLPCYQVSIVNKNVKVRARKSELLANKRVKPMVKKNPSNTQKIVVIGGGPAGATCVETLRQEGFDGELTMVCKEPYNPYDRCKVSKVMDFEIEKAKFRDDSFYKDSGITLLKGVEATKVDSLSKTVSCSNGQTLSYDKLFIASGSKPRKLSIPGVDLQNVVVLRNYDHSRYLNSQLSEDKHLVCLGGSFISLEAANYCAGKVKSVTVVLRDTLPFKAIWGGKVGTAVLKLFESKGVKFISRNGIKKINVNGEGAISSVELNDGQIINADILVMAVGSTYHTDFLKDSGIELRPDGSIETSEYLESNSPDVYVGGDIAYAPVFPDLHHKSAIGHYGLAHSHGRVAALNMLGKKQPLKSVPYFWTMLFGKGFRYAGHGNYDDVIYTGDVDGLKFVAYYLKNDVVIGTVSVGMDPVVSTFAEKITQGKKLLRSHLEKDPLEWVKTL